MSGVTFQVCLNSQADGSGFTWSKDCRFEYAPREGDKILLRTPDGMDVRLNIVNVVYDVQAKYFNADLPCPMTDSLLNKLNFIKRMS